jgi:hypothetical protein
MNASGPSPNRRPGADAGWISTSAAESQTGISTVTPSMMKSTGQRDDGQCQVALVPQATNVWQRMNQGMG